MLIAQLNRYLAYALEQSPRARELCAALESRRLKLEIEGLPGALVITVTHGTLLVTHASSAESAGSTVDVTVHASPVGLMALAGGDAAAVVGQGGASIIGEETLALQFQELARLLRPNLEAAAARVVGRMPAHLATRAFTLFAAWAGAARESAARNGAEYLAHESRDLVPRAEAESFFTGVEALRSAVASAELRAGQAAARLAALTPPGAT
jgi:ubiquinone biosynthesis protein UbiJ